MRGLSRLSTVSLALLLVTGIGGLIPRLFQLEPAQQQETSTDSKDDLFPSSIGARNAAIEAARAAGQRTYHYRTGFTPGLGIVGGASN